MNRCIVCERPLEANARNGRICSDECRRMRRRAARRARASADSLAAPPRPVQLEVVAEPALTTVEWLRTLMCRGWVVEDAAGFRATAEGRAYFGGLEMWEANTIT